MSTKILKKCSTVPSYRHSGLRLFLRRFLLFPKEYILHRHFPPCLNLNQSRGKEWGIERWRQGALVKIQRAGELNVPRSSPYQVTGSSGGWWHPCLSPLGKQTHQLYSIHFQNFLESSMEASVSHPLFLSPSPWFYWAPHFLQSACLQTGKLNSGFREAKLIKTEGWREGVGWE